MESNHQDNGEPQPNNAPMRIMKSQLNFFMTRLLFMQEQEADSLGARATANARRLNASNSSMNHSSSRMSGNMSGNDGVGIVSDNGVGHAANAALLGSYFDEPEPSDDICVYNDNARILPNRRAVSYPPVPFPKAAPESPKQVEGREGVKVVTPTHQTVDPLKVKAAELPQLPFTDMTLDDDHVKEDTMEEEEEEVQEQEEKMVTEEEEQVVEEQQQGPAIVPAEDMQEQQEGDDNDDEEEVPMEPAPSDSKSVDSTAAKPAPASVPRKSVSAIPSEARVFPKNQRRSKRYSTREPVKRSQSLGRKSDSDSVVSDDVSLPNMSTGSYH